MDKNLLIELDRNKQGLIIESAYMYFKKIFLNKEIRPTIDGKFIDINEKIKVADKQFGFWHSCSIGDDESKFDMLPCNNDLLSTECLYMCKSDSNNVLYYHSRIPCIYRANRFPILNECIQLYNERNTCKIKWWIQNNKDKDTENLMIRYIDKLYDYVAVFRIIRDISSGQVQKYSLTTSYPVVLKSYKRRYDKEFLEFSSKK